MNFKTKILNTLREGVMDDTIDVTTTKDNFKDTAKTVSDAKKQDSTIGDIDITLQNESKEVNPWAICTASVGREDKAKYERCVLDVKKEHGIKENLEEGMDDLQVPDDVEASEGEYLEKEKLKNDVAAASMEEGIEPLSGIDMKQFYNKKVKHKTNGLVGDVVKWGASKLKVKVDSGKHAGKLFTASPEELEILESTVVGRMSKGKLEQLVEHNKKIATAYKQIIKVADIKLKNG